MTRDEAMANLNLISVAFLKPITKEQRKIIDETFNMAIKALEQESKTLAEQEPKTIDRLYNWLSDIRFSIAPPDDTVMDVDEYNDRMIQVDLLDEILGWITSEV